MGVNENRVESYLRKEVTKLGGKCCKWVCPSENGMPDRIVMYHGVVYFVETKSLLGSASGVQKRKIQEIKRLGCNALVASTKAEVDEFIKIINDNT